MPSKPEVLRERRLNDPEYAERVREYARAYRERNAEKEKERQRLVKAKHREENREAYNAKMREWGRANSERLNREKRERLKNDPVYAEKIRSQERRRNAENPERVRNTNLKTIYGITLDCYRKMYEQQGGKCAICGDLKPDHGKAGLVVDHCHTAGHIRELLCANCNQALGKFRDNPVILQNAIAYLEKHRKEI